MIKPFLKNDSNKSLKFMSMLLMAAVVVTSTVVPNLNSVETVKAASVSYLPSELSVNGQKYDCYEDFIKAKAYKVFEWFGKCKGIFCKRQTVW